MSSAWNSAKTDNWEKRIGIYEDTRNPTPPKEREIPTPQPKDVDSEVQEVVGDVGEIVTTTGDVDVVEEETHLTSATAQVLIVEIVECNQEDQGKHQ
ncbi:hypothetical protein AB205_0139840 [Aquarana catesbeiana]|uniref:Uncharacterized protein n=1 Tax=Aquarana catesbeiana TaxID=8400 RepID=A0A2G9R3M1_AQUCT|nr:hypothetical protein AB205_0139840 [Aquarana catesbeiana]